MWTPLAPWIHHANGFEQEKVEHVSNCKLGPRNVKSLKSELTKVLVYTPQSMILCFPIRGYNRELLLLFNVV